MSPDFDRFLDRLKSLPETLDQSEMSILTNELINLQQLSIDEVLLLFTELSDKQYHSYEKPNQNNIIEVQKWIGRIYKRSYAKTLANIMVVYCLPKSDLAKILRDIPVEFRNEYETVLSRSIGEYLDPWFDLKRAH